MTDYELYFNSDDTFSEIDSHSSTSIYPVQSEEEIGRETKILFLIIKVAIFYKTNKTYSKHENTDGYMHALNQGT